MFITHTDVKSVVYALYVRYALHSKYVNFVKYSFCVKYANNVYDGFYASIYTMTSVRKKIGESIV